jgi:hypothetical protein
MADHYAWSNIYDGGESKVVRDPSGRERRVIVSRNIIEFGTKVTKTKIGDGWDSHIANGTIRPYAPPKDLPEDVSPAQHVLLELLGGKREIDQDMLLEMSLAPGAPVEEEKESEAPVGA